MTEPFIASPAPARTAALRETVIAALMLSAAAHAGAIFWAVAGGAAPDDALAAGGTVAIEVLLVQGPNEPAAARAPGAEEARADGAPAETGPSADRVAAADSLAATTFTRQKPPAPSAVQHAPAPPDAIPQGDGPAEAAPPPPPPKPAMSQAAAQQVARADAARPATEPDDAPADPAGGAGERDASIGAEGMAAAAPLAGNPAPDYPYAARRRGQHGRVLLRVDVAPSGEAGTIVVERSSGYETLDRAASQAVRQWRFRPARRNGAPVAATVQVPVRFDLQ